MNRPTTIHSERFYVDKLNNFSLLEEDLINFNKIVFHLYNVLFDKEYNNKNLIESPHLYIKHK